MFLGQFVNWRSVFGVCVYALIVLTGFFAGPVSVHARPRADAMLIIDTSISMSGKIGKKSKISLVRKAIKPALKSARPRLNLGVVFYGHRRRGDCKDVQHMIRLGRIRQKRYMEIINGIDPKGRTPVVSAINMAAGILKKRGQANSIILISDGFDICKGDPCKLGKKLQQKNSGLKVHVIALRSKSSKMVSLRCLAQRTGGKYTAVNTANALKQAVEDTFLVASSGNIPIPKFGPRRLAQLEKTIAEETIAAGAETQTIKEIPEITTTEITQTPKTETVKSPVVNLETTVSDKVIPLKPTPLPDNPVTVPEEISPDTKTAKPPLTAKAPPVEAPPVTPPPAETTTSALDAFFGPGKTTLEVAKSTPQSPASPTPAGSSEIVKNQGEDKKTVKPPAQPAQRQQTGLNLSAKLGSEGPVIEKDLFWRVFTAEKTGGKQQEIRQTGAVQPLLELKPGLYDITVQFGAVVKRKQVRIRANKVADVVLVLEAGIITARAVKVAEGKPLGQDIAYTLMSTAKDDTGNRTQISRKTAGKTQFFVSPGRYRLSGKFGATTVSTEVTVVAGKTSVASLVFNTGILKVSTIAGTGGAVIKGASYTVSHARAGSDGQRKELQKFFKNQNTFTLPAGLYLLKVQHGLANIERTIKIEANKTKALIVNLNAGYLKLFASPAKGAGILKDKVHYTIYKGIESLDGNREKITQSTKSSPSFWLPAGKYYIKADYGLASASVLVNISANNRTEETIILNAGALRLSSRVEGMPENLKSQLFYVVYEAKADIEGNHREVYSTSQAEKTVRIPPGEYIIEGNWGNTNARVPVSAIVTAGKLTRAVVIHRAGRAKFKLTAVPGGPPTDKPYWTFFDSNGAEIGRNVKATPERIFSAGKYSVVVRHGDQEFKAAFTVKSGDRKQIDIIARP